MKAYLITGVLAVVVSVALSFFVLGVGQDGQNGRDGKDGIGAVVGQELTNHMWFKSGLSEDGRFTIATTAAAFTLKDRDLRDAKVINISAMGAGQAALALTLPASTSWPSLTGYQSWVIDNNGTAAATTTTVTAGTGVDIDGTTANDDILNGGVSGRLDCWRLPTTGDVRCIVEEMVDAG